MCRRCAGAGSRGFHPRWLPPRTPRTATSARRDAAWACPLLPARGSAAVRSLASFAWPPPGSARPPPWPSGWSPAVGFRGLGSPAVGGSAPRLFAACRFGSGGGAPPAGSPWLRCPWRGSSPAGRGGGGRASGGCLALLLPVLLRPSRCLPRHAHRILRFNSLLCGSFFRTARRLPRMQQNKIDDFRSVKKSCTKDPGV